MEKILIINPYFGKFPPGFPVFLKSCAHNPTVDWLILTDTIYHGTVPSNVRMLHCTKNAVKDRIEACVGFSVNMDSPIKICDFRPAFGLVFAEEVAGFDFWGYCDFDSVLGNLRKFLTDQRLQEYDRIFSCGHLSIYRNTNRMNQLFTQDAPCVSHQQIFTSPKHYRFEEYGGMHDIMDHHEVAYLEGLDLLADINPANFRMTHLFRRNHVLQAYLWEEGATFRVFVENGEIQREEFAYIHFQKRTMAAPEADLEKAGAFWIEPDGFCVTDSRAVSSTDLLVHNRRSLVYDLAWRIKNFRQTRIGSRVFRS